MSTFYAGIWCWLTRALLKKDTEPSPAIETAVSVVVAFRNEEKKIPQLMDSLSMQQTTGFTWQIIFVDDHSTDQGPALVQKYLYKLPAGSRLIRLDRESGKKAAITKAVETCNTPWILVTDADCSVGREWVLSMHRYMQPNIDMVIGPVAYTKQTIWQKLLAFEFSSLVATGMAFARVHRPALANGANMAFRVSAFKKVGGYRLNRHIASGDDEFLLESIKREIGSEGIAAAFDHRALVQTEPPKNLSSFYRQRKRWVSKWKFGKDRLKKWIPLLLTGYYIWYIFAFIAFFLYKGNACIFFTALVLKVCADAIFLAAANRKLHRSFVYISFFIWELIYPVYALVFALAAHTGSVQWKGRKSRA